jgi:hypothetical protein
LLWVPPVIACGASGGGFSGDGDGGPGSSSGSGSGGDNGSSSGGTSSSGGGGFELPDVLPKGVMVSDSACQAGFYQGGFTGSYSSNLALGIPLSVSGNVELTLNQEGSSTQTCKVTENGEFTSESCNNVFTLSGGTITGVANQTGMIGDVGIGGFPYFCTMTGTLDCVKKILVNGWIECTYCVGPLGDGGGSCDLIGGHFAGPLTANYDTTKLAFTGGVWNGAEALCPGSNTSPQCNDGGSPGPEGGSIDNYLALDGGYGFLGKYGGAGGWNATCLNCNRDQ